MDDQRYLVTARKYRPSLFKEVVAQEHVTDTLKNALRLERLAHAYLFSGPRGVGKTTAARILAKAINCETPKDQREDEAEPCCECDSCRSFEEGRSLNVFEMDAASNNKVDDIRELREKVRIPPQGEQKKVYILDEVHMLSTQAFNALLKTLEEPPAHALFIFATTEPHKVLPTILSRCQRFDFRRIPVPQIVNRLREVCDVEGVEADEESLMLLARKGNGALRDALSAFDQALSLCGSTLEYGELTQALGVVDQDLFFKLTDHVATQNTAGMLRLVRRVVRSGYDLQEVLVGLAEHLRNLLVARSLGGDALEEVAASTRARYVDEAERFADPDLLRLLTMAGDAEDDIKQSPQPRLKLETVLLKMAQLRPAADLRTVLEKIDRLEQMAEDGELPDAVPADAAPTGPDRSTAADARSPEETAAETAPDEAANAETPTDAAEESVPDYVSKSDTVPALSHEDATGKDATGKDATGKGPIDEEPTDEEPTDEDPTDEDFSVEDEAPVEDEADKERELDEGVRAQESSESDSESDSEDDMPEGGGPSPNSRPSPGTGTPDEDPSVGYNDLFGAPALQSDESGEGGTDDATGTDATGTDATDDSARSEEASGGGSTQAAVAEPAVAATAPDGLATKWPRVIEAVKSEFVSAGALLGETEPVEYSRETITVAVPRELHRDTLRDRRAGLLRHLNAILDRSVEDVRFVVEARSGQDQTNGSTAEEPLSPREKLKQLRNTYPALDVLFSEFEAEPVW
jgi:DNA polymerase-3 subunit gamma/tau